MSILNLSPDLLHRAHTAIIGTCFHKYYLHTNDDASPPHQIVFELTNGRFLKINSDSYTQCLEIYTELDKVVGKVIVQVETGVIVYDEEYSLIIDMLASDGSKGQIRFHDALEESFDEDDDEYSYGCNHTFSYGFDNDETHLDVYI